MRAAWAHMVDVLKNCSFTSKVNFNDKAQDCMTVFLSYYVYTQLVDSAIYSDYRTKLISLSGDVSAETVK